MMQGAWGWFAIDRLIIYDAQRLVNGLAEVGRKNPGEDDSEGLSPRSARNAYALVCASCQSGAG
jgi:hypothetical protein